jgi:alkanesulfonate monooxygenase SsuD/methylene tetrahydromethanopterin reductase-like flavin-dependent oxidoreductase (luciferase family)
MDFGIALASNLDAWKTVKRAEELGLTHAWFYDSQMLVPDILVTMALAADKTSKIKLGMGVMVPTNRIAPVAANALASLNKLAPGRLFLASALASPLATQLASARCACPICASTCAWCAGCWRARQ